MQSGEDSRERPGPERPAIRPGLADPPGNARLTALAGTVLLVLFSAEVITTLLMGSLFGLHFFLGMVLIGPAGLKISSTVWRFCRYYLGSEPYVRRGAPPTLQRILGPVLVLTSAGVLGTGVLLAFAGPTGRWDKLHQQFFYLWLIIVIIHVVHYLPRLPELLRSHPARRAVQAAGGSRARWLLLAGACSPAWPWPWSPTTCGRDGAAGAGASCEPGFRVQVPPVPVLVFLPPDEREAAFLGHPPRRVVLDVAAELSEAEPDLRGGPREERRDRPRSQPLAAELRVDHVGHLSRLTPVRTQLDPARRRAVRSPADRQGQLVPGPPGAEVTAGPLGAVVVLSRLRARLLDRPSEEARRGRVEVKPA